MKKLLAIIMLAMLFCQPVQALADGGKEAKIKYNWAVKNKKYENFTDLGNYFIQLNDIDASYYEKSRSYLNKRQDIAAPPGCTAVIKRNAKGEVIVGRNMELEITQRPAFFTRVNGGKYKAITFSYGGVLTKYAYIDNHVDQYGRKVGGLAEMDKDPEYLRALAFSASDAFNEKGLYAEVNMRHYDPGYDTSCSGVKNDDPELREMRACISSIVPLVAINCATVKEALEFIKNSYNWYTFKFTYDGKHFNHWNLGVLIGDATGEYGLVEFAQNKIYYTPYANGHGNYYINPRIAEFSAVGDGYGRFAAALENLENCETETDMYKNMEKVRPMRQVMNPGVLGCSDEIEDMAVRRSLTPAQRQQYVEQVAAGYRDAVVEYYEKGNEKPLRDMESLWTASFNFGVNCSKKHLILRLWDRDDVMVDVQW